MAKVRLTTWYVRPDNFDKPNRDETSTLRPGDVIDAAGKELEHLRANNACEDYEPDKGADKAALDFSDAHVKRMREEHAQLVKSAGEGSREVQLSQARLDEAERDLAKVKARDAKPASPKSSA